MGRSSWLVCAVLGVSGSTALGRPLPNNVIYNSGIPTLLDTGANDLVADYGSPSLNHAAYYQALNAVKAGYSAVPAPGVGIYSTHGQTTTNTTSGKGGTILSLFDNDFGGSPGVTEWPSSSGHAVGTYCVIGKYTYIGDTDIDGQVTAQDYTAIDANFGGPAIPGVDVMSGDVNLDGSVTPADYTYVALNLYCGVSDPWAPLGLDAVPEPGSVALMGVAGLALCRRRRAR